MTMKMAKASEADLDAAVEVARLIGDLEKGWIPALDGDDPDSDESSVFDRDDPDECKRMLDAILDAAAKGSLFRVVYGMTVVLSAKNEVVDRDADYLVLHPKHIAAATDAARLDWLQQQADGGLIEIGFEIDGGNFLRITEPSVELDYREQSSVRDAIDAARSKQS